MGALYCAAIGLDRIREAAPKLGWWDLARPVWPSRGLLSFAPLERWLVDFIGDKDFADLAIPFAAVTTDLLTGETCVLREGRVAPAVRASCSIPGIVVPVEWNGRLLCDGSVTEIVPAAIVREMGAEVVIGVDIFTPSLRTTGGALGLGLSALEILAHRAGSGLQAADCLIVPDLARISYLRFAQGKELIALGEKAAEGMLPCIQAALG
jgi:NTE family protein